MGEGKRSKTFLIVWPTFAKGGSFLLPAAFFANGRNLSEDHRPEEGRERGCGREASEKTPPVRLRVGLFLRGKVAKQRILPPAQFLERSSVHSFPPLSLTTPSSNSMGPSEEREKGYGRGGGAGGAGGGTGGSTKFAKSATHRSVVPRSANGRRRAFSLDGNGRRRPQITLVWKRRGQKIRIITSSWLVVGFGERDIVLPRVLALFDKRTMAIERRRGREGLLCKFSHAACVGPSPLVVPRIVVVRLVEPSVPSPAGAHKNAIVRMNASITTTKRGKGKRGGEGAWPAKHRLK